MCMSYVELPCVEFEMLLIFTYYIDGMFRSKLLLHNSKVSYLALPLFYISLIKCWKQAVGYTFRVTDSVRLRLHTDILRATASTAVSNTIQNRNQLTASVLGGQLKEEREKI